MIPLGGKLPKHRLAPTLKEHNRRIIQMQRLEATGFAFRYDSDNRSLILPFHNPHLHAQRQAEGDPLDLGGREAAGTYKLPYSTVRKAQETMDILSAHYYKLVDEGRAVVDKYKEAIKKIAIE